MNCFFDLIYALIINLRQQDDNDEGTYTNQVGQVVRKVGFRRIRTMELLKTLMTALAKNFDVKDTEVLSETVRRRLLETMLWMIRTYPFCSTANQLAV